MLIQKISYKNIEIEDHTDKKSEIYPENIFEDF